MNRYLVDRVEEDYNFPRASGDEPNMLQLYRDGGEFSPREWG